MINHLFGIFEDSFEQDACYDDCLLRYEDGGFIVFISESDAQFYLDQNFKNGKYNYYSVKQIF